MKKIKYLLILLLFIPIIFVKAEKLNCGTYVSKETRSSIGIYADKNYGCDGKLFFIENDKCVAENVSIETEFEYGVLGKIKYKLWRNGQYDYALSTVGDELTGCPDKIIIFYSYDSENPDWSGKKYEPWVYSINGATNTNNCLNDKNNCEVRYTLSKSNDDNSTLTPSNKYDDVGACEGSTTYNYIKECGCIPTAFVDLTSRVFNLIKVIAPALLLIIGGFDLIKAVSAADEKAIQKEQTKLIKKFIAAFIIFMLFTIVQFVIGLIAKEGTLECVDYIINGYNP